MKFFMFSIDGILTIFSCFILVSSQQDQPFESVENITTELPCNQENGCNTSSITTVIPEISALNISEDKQFTTVASNQTSCPESGCQTEPSSPKIELSTNAIPIDNSSINSDNIEQNVTLTSTESVNVNESTEKTTAVTNDTELITILNDPDAIRSTINELKTTENLLNGTRIEPTASSNDMETNITTEDNFSVHPQIDNATTVSIELNNTAAITTNIGNASESSYSNFTTDISIETTTEGSNYTKSMESFENQTTTIDLYTIENNTDTNISQIYTTAIGTETTLNDSSVTEEPLLRNLSTETTVSTLETTLFVNKTEYTESTVIDKNVTDKITYSTLEPSTVTNHSSDSSTANYTTVFTIDDLPTVTPHRNYLTIEIKINCSSNEKQREISSSLAEFLNTTIKDSKECNILRNITVILRDDNVSFFELSQFLQEKYNTVQLVRILHNSKDTNMTREPVEVADKVTDREVILYISLGVCLGIVLLLAVVITCFKCLRKRSNKPLDLDVPHLNLRLEDYTLTRIPRPNTVYLDYFRGPIINDRYSSAPLSNSVNVNESERGLIQPFDTSVVPLEDAKKLEDLSSTPITRNDNTCPSTPLRTFGRKDWKNGDGLIYENIMSSSTEKLHSDFFKSGNRGQDNPTFAA